MKPEKVRLSVFSLALIVLLIISCGVFTPDSTPVSPTDLPTANHTPAPLASTSTADSEVVLAAAVTQGTLELGDIDQLDNGYVRAWMWFPGTLENVGNATLTDLRICVYLEYELAYPIAGDCSDLPDLAVGETTDYGVGFHAKAPPDAIAAASYELTVYSGDKKIGLAQ